MQNFSRVFGVVRGAALTALALFACSSGAQAQQQYYFGAFAGGNLGISGTADGTGSVARFWSPASIALRPDGNFVIADFDNHSIRLMTPAGSVTTIAGIPGSSGSADGPGLSAQFNYPDSVAVDSAGITYVADAENHTIRKIGLDGVVATLAGSPGMAGAVDGVGSAARFNEPYGITLDSTGNVYVAEWQNSAIRKVAPDGTVSTVAGLMGVTGTTDATGTSARFAHCEGVTIDPATGTLYVADTYNHTIRQIASSGTVTTLAGTPGVSGTGDGVGSGAQFYHPDNLLWDPVSGSLYVADSWNFTIRRVMPDGTVTTLAGCPGKAGVADGVGSTARFGKPIGLALDPAGTLYITDYSGCTIRRMTSDGTVTTVAGETEGMGEIALSLANPRGVAVDAGGNVYIADTDNQVIEKVTSAGAGKVLAGNFGNAGSLNGTGTAARFNGPQGVAVDQNGNVYVADSSSSTIRKITQAGAVTTLAGKANNPGHAEGLGAAARFGWAAGLVADSAGNIYVADGGNMEIRKITPAGLVSTLAGSWTTSGTSDGTGSAASFAYPNGIAIDSAGNLYVADSPNHTIRKVTLSGVVTTIAGTPGVSGTDDGPVATALFNGPTGVAVDANGNIYVADRDNQAIRKISTAGMVSTIGGTPGTLGCDIGIGGAALFSEPFGIAVGPQGNVYVADTQNGRVAVGSLWQVSGGVTSYVGGQDAVVTGSANPNNGLATVWFEYGADTSYGSQTDSQDIGGIGYVTVSGTLTGPVVPGWHYRMVVSSGGNTYYGDDMVLSIPTFVTMGLASTKDASPGIPGGAFTSLGNPVINNLNHIAFQAFVAGGTATGIKTANNCGIWADTGNQGRLLVARTGSPAPGTTGTFATLSDPVYASDDAVAFVGTLVKTGTDSTSISAQNNTGIWAGVSGSLALVARTGSPAPDAAGATSASSPVFSSFAQIVLPDQGGVVFVGNLKAGTAAVPGPGGVVPSNSQAIWAQDTAGVLKQLIRKGDGLTVKGVAKTVSTLTIFNAPAMVAGQTRHFNNPGDLIYKIGFTDGSISLITTVFP